MATSKSIIPFKAIGYALLWQSYWLPVLLIVLHDQWLQGRQLQPPDHPQHQPALPAPSQAQAQPPLASVLAAEPQSADALPVLAREGSSPTPAPGRPGQGPSSHDLKSHGPTSPPVRPALSPAQVWALPRGTGPLGSASLGSASLRPAAQPRLAMGRPSLALVSGVDRTSPVLRQFSGSELLGGPLTLDQPGQEAMSPLARAEQARLADAGDPLAPVPARWREPMRRELQGLGAPRLSQARVVHVPSQRITHTVVLPLAMQHDGSIDALVAKDPAVSDRDLSDWASRQAAPAPGSVQPVVLHLHPLPKSAVMARVTQPPPLPAPAPALAPGPAPTGGLP